MSNDTFDFKKIAQAYFDERFPKDDNGLHQKRRPCESDVSTLEMVLTDASRFTLTQPARDDALVALEAIQDRFIAAMEQTDLSQSLHAELLGSFDAAPNTEDTDDD